jgi:hypothetical protein
MGAGTSVDDLPRHAAREPAWSMYGYVAGEQQVRLRSA